MSLASLESKKGLVSSSLVRAIFEEEGPAARVVTETATRPWRREAKDDRVFWNEDVAPPNREWRWVKPAGTAAPAFAAETEARATRTGVAVTAPRVAKGIAPIIGLTTTPRGLRCRCAADGKKYSCIRPSAVIKQRTTPIKP
jgi:hypothetical protein